MTGMSTARATARVECAVEAVAAAVAVHAGEQDLPRSAPGRLARPFDGVDAGGLAAAGHVDLPLVAGCRPPAFASMAQRIACVPKAASRIGDELAGSPRLPSSPTPCRRRRRSSCGCRPRCGSRRPRSTADAARLEAWLASSTVVARSSLVAVMSRKITSSALLLVVGAAPARWGRPHRAGPRSSHPSRRGRPLRPGRGLLSLLAYSLQPRPPGRRRVP